MPVVKLFTGSARQHGSVGKYKAPVFHHGAGNGIRTNDHRAAERAEKYELARRMAQIAQRKAIQNDKPVTLTAAQINEINAKHWKKK